ncbi:hypothetical protein [Saccharothrix sp. ST-888]|uniref:hypothetical protein n=1 Tax=Saccharothrix sp. ST-888 TaxID=1427391 RepID=UPI0005EC95B4|nr:hypothetical protein [Saccharothrix sp. ST-888]KJK55647.1 hypothetical protein UK12_27390 [Saccharothrix sp. ST-888]
MAGPQINLPALVTSLNIDMSGIAGSQADAAREGTALGERLGDAMRRRLQVAADSLPPVRVNADTGPADRDLAQLREKLAALADKRIGVDISTAKAVQEIDDLQTHLERLALTHPDVEVHADIGEAIAALAAVTAAARHVDEEHPHVDVRVDEDHQIERATRDLSGLTGALGSAAGPIGSFSASLGTMAGLLGAIGPVLAGTAQAMAALAPAAALAAPAVLSLGLAGGAVKAGLGGIGDAFKAAFAPAGPAVAAAAQATHAYEDAQRSLADTIQNTADSNTRALRNVGDAERNLADAQKASLQAQRDLDDARRQATMDLEDQQNKLADAQLSQRDATLRVTDAKQALDAAMKSPAATEQQRAQAQLAYDQAVQRLKEQELALQRVKSQTDIANAAGVDGAQKVVQAQDKLALSQRNVGDQARNLSDAQEQVSKTAHQGEEAIRRAQEALTQAAQQTSAATGAVDKFGQAMAKLAPSAREFVQEVVSLKDAWSSLRLDVQQQLFAGLAGHLDRAATAVLPVLRQGLVQAAGALNLMGSGAIDAAGNLAESGVLGQALGSAATGLRNLAGLPALVIHALGTIGAAAGPAFERLTEAAGGALTKVAARLDSAFSSGGLQRAIDVAIQQFGVLFGVIGNVGRIIGAIFGPAQQSGATFLDTLKKITGQIADSFSAPAVQAGLRSLFTTMATLASTVAPVLGQALQVLGPVLAALGPPVQALITALGQALSPIIAALGPVLLAGAQAVGQLVLAASPLLGLVGTLASALLPVLTPLLAGLGVIFGQLQPLVQAVSDGLSAFLAPILAQLPSLVTPFVTVLTALTGAVLPVLTQLIQQLPLGQLGENFAQVAIALAPVLTQLALLISAGLQALLPLLPPVIQFVSRLATALSGELAAQIQQTVLPALRMVTQLLAGDFSGAFDSAGQVVENMIKLAVREFVLLPGQILAAIGDLAVQLWDAGSRLIGGLIDGIKSKIPSVKGVLSNLTDMLPSWKGPPERDARLLTSAGHLVMDGFMAGIAARVPDLRTQLQGITGQIEGMGASLGGPSIALAGSPGALAQSYAGLGRPVQQTNTINMYGSGATAAEVSAELSWRAKVGVR